MLRHSTEVYLNMLTQAVALEFATLARMTDPFRTADPDNTDSPSFRITPLIAASGVKATALAMRMAETPP